MGPDTKPADLLQEQRGSRKESSDLLSGQLSHVTLCISNVEKAKQFYVGVLGLAEIPRPNLPQPGIWIGAGAQSVHLIVPRDPAELPRPRILDRTPIAPHLAFCAPNLGDVIAKLRTLGEHVLVSEYVPDQAFVLDPDFNLIELNGEAPQSSERL